MTKLLCAMSRGKLLVLKTKLTSNPSHDSINKEESDALVMDAVQVQKTRQMRD